jgi:hypothetical protein
MASQDVALGSLDEHAIVGYHIQAHLYEDVLKQIYRKYARICHEAGRMFKYDDNLRTSITKVDLSMHLCGVKISDIDISSTQ